MCGVVVAVVCPDGVSRCTSAFVPTPTVGLGIDVGVGLCGGWGCYLVVDVMIVVHYLVANSVRCFVVFSVSPVDVGCGCCSGVPA